MRIAVMCLVLAGGAQASNVINNGGFESGLAGWTSQTRDFGTTTGTCNSQFAAETTGSGCVVMSNPVFGSEAAYASTTIGPGAASGDEWIDDLSQAFVVPGSFSSAIVTYEAEVSLTGSGSNFRGGGAVVQLYQGNTATDNTFFISNMGIVVNPFTDTNIPWTGFSWDVSSILAPYAGQLVTLDIRTFAFAGTGTSPTVNLGAGFDQVTATFASPTTVPEPATWLSLVAGCALLAAGKLGKA